jgi:glycosyltransferase involved in cell wall biosynthesis
MPHKLPTIALYYDDDAYVEPVRASGRSRAPGRALGLMGRQVAGHEFLRAYLGHGSWTELVALVRDERSIASLKLRWRQKPWSPRGRSLRIVQERRFHDAFLRDLPASVLHLPCPPDSRYAWARRGSGPHAFAISGVTHTMCSLEAVRQVCDYLTAPFEPYDLLICTSAAVMAMVREVSGAYARHLRERLGGRPALGPRLSYVPLGVDTDRFRPATPAERAERRRELGIGDEEFAVLFAGRLSHHAKAHPFPMFDGLAREARETGRAVHLLLAGWAASPQVHAAFVEGARQFAPGVRATFVDGEDPQQRLAVWRAADLFTSFSDNIQETFGLVLVEATACGLPVVASDWDGYRDLAVDGETGLLVPTAMVAGATDQTTARLILGEVDYDHFLAECSQATVVDPAAAAAAFGELLSNPDRCRAMGEAGRRRALERFTWPRIIARYEALWAEQEDLRRAFSGRGATPAPEGPDLYPEPERSFRSYPTRWLGPDDRLQSDAAAAVRLPTFLETPLTHHAGDRRVRDPSVLADVIAAAAYGCTVAGLDEFFRRVGGKARAGRATLAWLLKYGLLSAVEPSTLDRTDPDRWAGTSAHSTEPRRLDTARVNVCFVTACMDRLAHLRETLGRLATQPGCSCVVVDYSCPEHSGEWVEAHYPTVRVVRVEGRTYFHRSEARNRGAAVSDATWLCFVDADVRLAPHFAEALLARLEPGTYCCADAFAEGTEGTFACAREDFERAGGYDDALRDWGEEDNDLYDALAFLGVRRTTFPVALLEHLPHCDEARGRFHAMPPAVSHAVNRVYRILKWDTARLRGGLLTVSMRALIDLLEEPLSQYLGPGQRLQVVQGEIPERPPGLDRRAVLCQHLERAAGSFRASDPCVAVLDLQLPVHGAHREGISRRDHRDGDEEQGHQPREPRDLRISPGHAPEPFGCGYGVRENRVPLQETPQVVGEFLGGRVAPFRLFLKAPQADRLEVARDLRL